MVRLDHQETLVPGRIAKVRQRLYLIERVVPPPNPADSTLVGLSCIDDDAQGQPLEVLWERELEAEVMTGEAWDAISKRGFDPPAVFSAYLNTLRWNCVTATDPRLFQSPFRAGIRLDAYQLDPLQKALLLPRVNLFIADDVGLGKTIEAALIARELLLRKKAREIVVCCPPSMLLQWQDELETRFGLVFEILDKDYVQRVRRERGFGVNPWSTHARFLVSQRLLVDEAYAGPLRDWLGDFRSGSLLILDEAHHAAPSSGQKYAIDSKITQAVRDLAHRFEHRLFLSATPHNGHSNSFSALLEILDPQRFCRGVPVDKNLLHAVMVRRLKDDLRETGLGAFPLRRVVQIDIDGLPADAPELRLAALLDQYRQLREERLSGETRRKQAAAGLLITGLQQRLLSSVEAFARTLAVHRRTVKRHWEEAQKTPAKAASPQLQLDLIAEPPGSDDDRATLPIADLQAEEEAQIAAATMATALSTEKQAAELYAREQRLLDEMAEIADAARAEPDARIRKLLDWIQKKMCPGLGKPGAPWNDLRIIIFTEYDDTKRYLQQQIGAAVESSDRAEQRIAIYHGPTPPDEREAIKHAFNADPRQHPVRILIATDAAREGLNLQAHCCNLFHFDVPWNPSRMEQRNGRIDRKLQEKPEVFCHYFVYKQRPEDRILKVLVQKTERIKKELGSLAQVIDARLADTLRSGIRRDRIEKLEKEILTADLDQAHRRTVEDELESNRQRQNELRRQVDMLRDLVEKSRASIGFDEAQFRQAISCSLELLGAEALQRAEDGPDDISSFRFPALDQRDAADPTWADTLDTLRAPRERGQKLWEWRRESPIRPIVFEDTGKLDDKVVHLHLEHRVVRRLLSRFVAQGFVYHDLSRACLAQTADAIPRAILLGRLCLYGPGAARLHEEILPVTARWIDPTIRKEPLFPYAREAEAKTLQLLRDSLTHHARRQTEKPVQQQLLASAARDVTELLPHLQARAEEYARDAREKLLARGRQEAHAMKDILETQKKHISATEAKHAREEKQGLLLFDNPDEQRQLEANKRHWTKRLMMIDQELQTEPQRIADLYQVQATRIEPVGLIYLWPVTG
jgi:superfamily II DNA or RNA helicase